MAARRAAATVLVGALAACTSVSRVTIEPPVPPRLDVAAFTRVLVAGFLAGGSEEFDVNLETVQLLRRELRARAQLRVIDADELPLLRIALEQARAAAAPPPASLRSEKDLDAYAAIFANAAFWQHLGAAYQQPLIVTGTVWFAPLARAGVVLRVHEVFDPFGRRQIVPVRRYQDQRGHRLSLTCRFIDGRTGTPLATEAFREEVLHDAQQAVPARAAYFELMDRVLPAFLQVLSPQRVPSPRTLLK